MGIPLVSESMNSNIVLDINENLIDYDFFDPHYPRNTHSANPKVMLAIYPTAISYTLHF